MAYSDPVQRRRRLRRALMDLVLLGCACSGLLTLYVGGRAVPPGWVAAQYALAAMVLWQLSWYTLRLLLMIAIWRRERAISAGRKLWIGLTVPIPGIIAIYLGRGRLSLWLDGSPGEHP